MKLSAIILTKNEEEMIEDCLRSINNLADEIIIIDDESKDKTLELAKRYNCKIIIHKKINFSNQRELGLIKASGDWVLYIDADERVSKELKNEIEITVKENTKDNGYFFKRENYYLGKKWPYEEKVQKLFKKSKLKGWFGELHETPIIDGEFGVLNTPLIHYTHRNITEMLEKTIEWSKIEAKLRFDAKHPKVTWWRFLRVMTTEFFHYFIGQKGYKVGTVGLIESIYQSFSIFITYARLFEMQSNEIKIQSDSQNPLNGGRR